MLGYPPPDFYNLLTDPCHPVGKGVKLFSLWLSGYHAHEDSAHKTKHRTPLSLQEPSLTILTPISSFPYFMVQARCPHTATCCAGCRRSSENVLCSSPFLRLTPLGMKLRTSMGGMNSNGGMCVWINLSGSPFERYWRYGAVSKAEMMGRAMWEVTLIRLRKTKRLIYGCRGCLYLLDMFVRFVGKSPIER